MRYWIVGFLLILFLNVPAVYGQPCLVNGIDFTTQGGIDSFPAHYPGCDQIAGHVKISGGDIVNLDSLVYLTAFGGNLNIENCENLSSIQGLANVTSIGGSLHINNTGIASLQGLDNLTAIAGDMKIKVNLQLSSLAPLSNLTSIGGRVEIIYNTQLTDLTGLEGIHQVPDDLFLGGNTGLVSLHGLENLQSIGKRLFIGNSNSLLSLDGLQALTTIQDTLFIVENQSLSSIQQLSSLTSVNGLQIKYNPQLQSLEGLENIQALPQGGLVVIGNPRIKTMSGLQNLQQVGGQVELAYLDSLESLSGLEQLTMVGDFFSLYEDARLNDISALSSLDSILGDFLIISYCDSLKSLEGLDNLSYIGGSTIVFRHNPVLSFCGTPALCHLVKYSDFVHIEDNAPGCNSSLDIEATCGIPVIQGFVMADLNENCQADLADVPLSEWLLTAYQNSDTLVAVTDSSGFYRIFAQAGDYTLEIQPKDGWDFSCGSTTVQGNLSGSSDIDTINFLAQKSSLCKALLVDATSTYLRPCSAGAYTVEYCNTGTQTLLTPQIRIAFSEALTVDSAEADYVNPSDNVYIFDGDTLQVGQCKSFKVFVTLDCDVLDEQAICADVRALPDTLCQAPDPGWSEASIRLELRCDADSIRPVIKNVGTGIMSAPQTYEIIIEDWVVLKTDVQLPAGDSVVLPAYEKDGRTYTLRGPQEPLHPGDSRPLVSLEGCGVNSTNTFSTGYVLQFPEDDNDPFVSIDCQEILPANLSQQHFPKGVGPQHYIERGDDIEYKTLFRNTTNDTIHNIVIKQIISPYLDIASIQLLAASHPYQLSIIGDTLVMHFAGITLPDSASAGAVQSTGFVKYRLAQKPGLPNGTVIYNSALIHYGTQPAEETNEVFNTIGENFIPVGNIPVSPDDARAIVHPNPAKDFVSVRIEGIPFRRGQLILYDLSGNEVKRNRFKHKDFKARLDGLPAGMYYYRILLDGSFLLRGKLIVMDLNK